MYMVARDGKKNFEYKSSRTKEALVSFMADPQAPVSCPCCALCGCRKRCICSQPPPPPPPEATPFSDDGDGDVRMIQGEADFEVAIGEADSVLIMFYAPW